MKRNRPLRGGLLLLAASSLTVWPWALPAPRVFYDYFPLPGRGWISALGPYDEHLVQVSLVVYLVYAALRLPPHDGPTHSLFWATTSRNSSL